MREVLGAIRGKFILTINDKPEVRALFDGFQIEPVRVSYGISKSAATEARELIITRI